MSRISQKSLLAQALAPLASQPEGSISRQALKFLSEHTPPGMHAAFAATLAKPQLEAVAPASEDEAKILAAYGFSDRNQVWRALKALPKLNSVVIPRTTPRRASRKVAPSELDDIVRIVRQKVADGAVLSEALKAECDAREIPVISTSEFSHRRKRLNLPKLTQAERSRAFAHPVHSAPDSTLEAVARRARALMDAEGMNLYEAVSKAVTESYPDIPAPAANFLARKLDDKFPALTLRNPERKKKVLHPHPLLMLPAEARKAALKEILQATEGGIRVREAVSEVAVKYCGGGGAIAEAETLRANRVLSRLRNAFPEVKADTTPKPLSVRELSPEQSKEMLKRIVELTKGGVAVFAAVNAAIAQTHPKQTYPEDQTVSAYQFFDKLRRRHRDVDATRPDFRPAKPVPPPPAQKQ